MFISRGRVETLRRLMMTSIILRNVALSSLWRQVNPRRVEQTSAHCDFTSLPVVESTCEIRPSYSAHAFLKRRINSRGVRFARTFLIVVIRGTGSCDETRGL